MTGERSGVGTRLQESNPRIIRIHCVNHRAGLALSDALEEKGHDYMSKSCRAIVEQLYKHLAYSSVRQALFDSCQLELGADMALNIIEAAPTRWHSWKIVVHRIRDVMPAILRFLRVHVEEIDDPVSKGLLKSINTLRFQVCLLGLCDALPFFDTLHLQFERNELDFAQINDLVNVRLLCRL